jgi:hypothetical protein
MLPAVTVRATCAVVLQCVGVGASSRPSTSVPRHWLSIAGRPHATVQVRRVTAAIAEHKSDYQCVVAYGSSISAALTLVACNKPCPTTFTASTGMCCLRHMAFWRLLALV